MRVLRGLVLAAVVPVLLAGCAAAPVTARPSPTPSGLAQALRSFRAMADAQSQGPPYAVSYVLTVYGAAEAHVTPGDTDSTDPALATVALTAVGRFDGSLEKGPSGLRPPVSQRLTAALLLPSGAIACWSESDRDPHLADLGRVVAVP